MTCSGSAAIDHVAARTSGPRRRAASIAVSAWVSGSTMRQRRRRQTTARGSLAGCLDGQDGGPSLLPPAACPARSRETESRWRCRNARGDRTAALLIVLRRGRRSSNPSSAAMTASAPARWIAGDRRTLPAISASARQRRRSGAAWRRGRPPPRPAPAAPGAALPSPRRRCERAKRRSASRAPPRAPPAARRRVVREQRCRRSRTHLAGGDQPRR